MPHFGLMNEDELGPVEGPLMRARLHIRCGRRRLREGKVAMGIITLFDAVESALQWYFADPDHQSLIRSDRTAALKDGAVLFDTLVQSGVIVSSFDYASLNDIVERALKDETASYEYEPFLQGIEAFMTQIGVMPFDENALPPEDPATP